MSEFDRDRLAGYRECRLSFCYTSRSTDLIQTPSARIWNQFIAETHTERHAGCQSPLRNNSSDKKTNILSS